MVFLLLVILNTRSFCLSEGCIISLEQLTHLPPSMHARMNMCSVKCFNDTTLARPLKNLTRFFFFKVMHKFSVHICGQPKENNKNPSNMYC